MEHSISEWWWWPGFFMLIFIMLFVDLFLLGGKKAHAVSIRESLSWITVWVTLALTFNLLLWQYLTQTIGYIVANQKALEFLTGYLIEVFLSVDNMFVFIIIFNHFSIPFEYQKRILFYGILSAIVFRFILILMGVILVNKYHWILYLFGFLLLLTGLKMILFSKEERHLSKDPILNFLCKHLRMVETFAGEKFFIKKNKLRYATPLFLVLLLIEISDLIFALDSIPAIFAITDDYFIIFTSNIFAILGLRSMYFLVANMTQRFYYLKYAIALILVFIGLKMLAAYWFKLSSFAALGIIISILTISIILSAIQSRHLDK